jgi:hypothetical protein
VYGYSKGNESITKVCGELSVTMEEDKSVNTIKDSGGGGVVTGEREWCRQSSCSVSRVEVGGRRNSDRFVGKNVDTAASRR